TKISSAVRYRRTHRYASRISNGISVEPKQGTRTTEKDQEDTREVERINMHERTGKMEKKRI
ncbi:hypothetical protein GW17_00054425, partial [Ensete ventricosum]